MAGLEIKQESDSERRGRARGWRARGPYKVVVWMGDSWRWATHTTDGHQRHQEGQRSRRGRRRRSPGFLDCLKSLVSPPLPCWTEEFLCILQHPLPSTRSRGDQERRALPELVGKGTGTRDRCARANGADVGDQIDACSGLPVLRRRAVSCHWGGGLSDMTSEGAHRESRRKQRGGGGRGRAIRQGCRGIHRRVAHRSPGFGCCQGLEGICFDVCVCANVRGRGKVW